MSSPVLDLVLQNRKQACRALPGTFGIEEKAHQRNVASFGPFGEAYQCNAGMRRGTEDFFLSAFNWGVAHAYHSDDAGATFANAPERGKFLACETPRRAFGRRLSSRDR